MTQSIQRITQTDTNYPERLKDNLKTEAPETIWARGTSIRRNIMAQTVFVGDHELTFPGPHLGVLRDCNAVLMGIQRKAYTNR